MDHASRPVPHMAPGLGTTIDSSPARPGYAQREPRKSRAYPTHARFAGPNRVVGKDRRRQDQAVSRPSDVQSRQDTTRHNESKPARHCRSPLDRRRPTSQVTKSPAFRDLVRRLNACILSLTRADRSYIRTVPWAGYLGSGNRSRASLNSRRSSSARSSRRADA
jgi:hypothetical protein